MNVIGLEVSTSAAKGILFSLEEGVIKTVSVQYREGAETLTIDPQEVLTAAKAVLTRIVESTDRPISAIGLGGAWHSLLLLDEKRLPLGPIYTWADVSASSTVERLRKDREFVLGCYQRTGNMVHAMYPAWKYYHLQATAPETIQRTRFISSQLEYVFEHLTGETGVSKCLASASGFFNIHQLDWDEEILRFVNLDRSQFAELKEPPFAAGLRAALAQETGLAAGIPVTVGYADGALNQVGIGGDREGIMSFSVGTSAAIRMVSPVPKIPATPSTWCYYLYHGKRLVGASTQGACSCVDWFLNNLPPNLRSYDLLEEAASKIKIAEAPFFLPFLFGERCPGWQDRRLGNFMDLKPGHGLGDLYFAILEGVLFNVYHCYQILTEIGGVPEEIMISGGIMNSRLWLQMAADIFERDLLTTGVTNDSTVGAAILGLQAAGGMQVGEGFVPKTSRGTPPPSKNSPLYRERFQRYLELYQATSME